MAQQKKIMVVDDEPDVCEYISIFLEDEGFEVVIANDGDQALKEVQQGEPDLVTLDITMPEKSGVRFYKEMRESEKWRHIPIIIVTGISEDFEKFISTRKKVPPPDGFFSKPIDRERLLESIKNLIGT